MKMCGCRDCRRILAESDIDTRIVLHRAYAKCITRYPRGIVRAIVGDYLDLHRNGDPWKGCWRD